jgi:hypothetical protein
VLGDIRLERGVPHGDRHAKEFSSNVRLLASILYSMIMMSEDGELQIMAMDHGARVGAPCSACRQKQIACRVAGRHLLAALAII